jgi:hypothetical protein
MRFAPLAALCLPALAASPLAAQQAAPSMADRIANDPRVEALNPYGLNLPPAIRADKGVQFGKAIRIPLSGHAEIWRVGITTPVLKPVKKGDRIIIAFWARAEKTEAGAPGKIGRVQLEATPVIRTVFEQAFDVGPEWKMYQLKGVADQDYAPRQLNAAMHLDAAKQVLDIGPVFVLDMGQPAQ